MKTLIRIMIFATVAGSTFVAGAQTSASSTQGKAVVRATPTPAPSPTPAPPKLNPGVAPAPISMGPQYSPAQLDFGSLWDGESARRTLTLTPPAAGTITLSFPSGSVFFLAEYRELAAAKGSGNNANVLPLNQVPARQTYQVGGIGGGTLQWMVGAGSEVQLDFVFQPVSHPLGLNITVEPGAKTVSAKFSGAGTTPWSVTVPLRGVFNGSKAQPYGRRGAASPPAAQAAAPPATLTSTANVASPSTSAQKFTVEDLKLRLSALQGLKVKTSARTRNPAAMAAQHGPVSGGLNSGVVPSGNSTKLSMRSGPNPPTPGIGQADPGMSRQTASASPCRGYTKKDPLLVAIDGQPGPWVFSDESHLYRLEGCNFGSPKRLLFLHSTDPSAGWAYDLPVSATQRDSEEIQANVLYESFNGKIVSRPDSNSVELRMLDEGNPGKYWVLGNGKFHGMRGDPVPLAVIPAAFISAFPQGGPYVMAPMTNFYGVDGAMGVVRTGLTNSIPLGQDTVKPKLKNGFDIDSAQLVYLVADNQGQNSTVTADSSSLKINGNVILINYPISSTTQNGKTFFYSIYGLKVWVVGPKGIDPW